LNAARVSAGRVAADSGWQAEGEHLLGSVHLLRGNFPEAVTRLESALQSGASAFQDHAWALLGWLNFEQREYVSAARSWLQVSRQKRQEWGIHAVEPGVAFLAGIQGFKANGPQAAFEWLKLARERNWQDPRLNVLYERALVEATCQIVDKNAEADLQPLL